MATEGGKAEAAGLADEGGLAVRAVGQLLHTAIAGAGPFKGAAAVAEEIRAKAADPEAAIDRLIALHLRLAAASGALTGLGGLVTMPITIPAGLSGYYLVAGRLVGGVAHLRGYDLDSEEVHTALLLTMVGGGAATQILRETGIELGRRSAVAAVRRVSGKTLIEINKKVGFRLFTKAGTTGVINLGKMVPFVGAPIGATTDLISMRAVAAFARSSFPPVSEPDADDTPAASEAEGEGSGLSARPVAVDLDEPRVRGVAQIKRLNPFRV
ncbi:EcsC protein family protein [Parafrankia irregularis]|uniref:EcsC protein family protein n=1 Tax=Parafrankia irregularis TaxID=795642 RepID=A0A0S4QEK9_9ACTN|nr:MULTISPECIES: EcsC family protein [Parafrankia]MBE3199443.1 EcsC family protein [Parafrankia sp. CH37]CUU53895.1 EcsC protein family protein [Parafrankia irregularis]